MPARCLTLSWQPGWFSHVSSSYSDLDFWATFLGSCLVGACIKWPCNSYDEYDTNPSRKKFLKSWPTSASGRKHLTVSNLSIYWLQLHDIYVSIGAVERSSRHVYTLCPRALCFLLVGSRSVLDHFDQYILYNTGIFGETSLTVLGRSNLHDARLGGKMNSFLAGRRSAGYFAELWIIFISLLQGASSNNSAFGKKITQVRKCVGIITCSMLQKENLLYPDLISHRIYNMK